MISGSLIFQKYQKRIYQVLSGRKKRNLMPPAISIYIAVYRSVFVLVHKLSVAVEGTPYHGFSPGRIGLPKESIRTPSGLCFFLKKG